MFYLSFRSNLCYILILVFVSSCSIVKRNHLKGYHIQKKSVYQSAYKTEVKSDKNREIKKNKSLSDYHTINKSTNEKITPKKSTAIIYDKSDEKTSDFRNKKHENQHIKTYDEKVILFSTEKLQQKNNLIQKKNPRPKKILKKEVIEDFLDKLFPTPENIFLKILASILIFSFGSFIIILLSSSLFLFLFIVGLILAILTDLKYISFSTFLEIFGYLFAFSLIATVLISSIGISFFLIDFILIRYNKIQFFDDKPALKTIAIILVASILILLFVYLYFFVLL